MFRRARLGCLVLALATAWVVPLGGSAQAPATAAAAEPAQAAPAAHGLAMHGDLKYPADFKHFGYVNPDAPKGGTLRRQWTGTFDSFNPFVLKGNPEIWGEFFMYDTLLTAAADEPFSQYGLLAETVQTPEDRSWVVFTLRKEARWHDGKPVTADDVLWSFQTLVKDGQPLYRLYYGSVAKVEKVGEHSVRFTFKPGDNRELPLILGQLPVLPKHYWAGKDFAAGTLEPPLSSGPYKIGRFEAGRFVDYERVPDYWGKDLPVNRGRFNFDRVRFDYFRDDKVALEAFKAGDIDLRRESSAKNWATEYEMPERKDGRLRVELFPNDRPSGMQGFAFNTRRELFKDARVRRALGYAFDFEWSNQTLFYGQYKRTRSYFDNSELAATGLPGGAELALLEPHRAKLPPEVFTQEYQPPRTDGEGGLRANLRKASELLREAGFTVQDKQLRRGPGGPALEFEILLDSQSFERIALPLVQNLERIGVKATVRTVDEAQFQQRTESFDFDVTLLNVAQSNSPGNEQREFWGSAAAAQQGSRNLAGIADPVVDDLIEKVIAARDRASLIAATRALDRALQWGHYLIPHYHLAGDRVAFWNKLAYPEVMPAAGVELFLTWWQAREAPAQTAQR
jgi:microcin C transport system substrate-binding protein